MKTQRIIAILAVLVLVVGLEVVLMNRCTREDASAPLASTAPSDAPDQAATAPPVASAMPTEPGFTSPPGPGLGVPTEPPAATAAPTNPPAPTQAPTEPPAPTPAPTEPPAGSVGSTVSSGSFSSNTGLSLNISVSWKAVNQGDGSVRLDITGTVNSYALNAMALPVSISFGGYSTSVTANSVNVTGSSMASNTLFSTSMSVPADMEDTMTVTWNYNGTYSDTSLSEITASGYVNT